jgi:iron-sulfur cluster repair protein YtfE (RIC family)
MSDFEITALVLAEHEVFRREFSSLEDLSGQELAAAWEALHARLEVHAVAEEQLFYPLLAQEAPDGEQETEEGVHDHNEIRHAATAVEEHEVGSEDWWEAVRNVRQVNADHMAEEETDFFPSFKEAVDDEQREALGMRWLAFHDEHEQAEGLSGEDAEVAEVVATEVPEGDPTA